MIFEQDKRIEKVGEKLGYILSYFLFTTILFFVLFILNKIPDSWSYIHIAALTILIALTGIGLKKILK